MKKVFSLLLSLTMVMALLAGCGGDTTTDTADDSTTDTADTTETTELSGNGWYGFGANGKLIKTGFVTGSGKTYYYADGVRAKGLTKIGEDCYFFTAGSGGM